jgi:CRP-like cAMP-binding protein
MTTSTPSAHVVKKLKKGELLFNEGDASSSMYLIKSGTIRLFIKKGNSNVEIDSVGAGEILGELAFLDGHPRSLSGEALHDSELIEISHSTFQNTLEHLPDWLKILLKTVAGRLRSATNELRLLKAANEAINYSLKEPGAKRTSYQYLSWHEFMKIGSAILIESHRSQKTTPEGIEIFSASLGVYANAVGGVPLSKIESVIDVLEALKATTRSTDAKSFVMSPAELQWLDSLVRHMAEENRLEPSKRHDISARSATLMRHICTLLPDSKTDTQSGLTAVNVAELNKIETHGFHLDELNELIQVGFLTPLQAHSAAEVLTLIKTETFTYQLRYAEAKIEIQALNRKKEQLNPKG